MTCPWCEKNMATLIKLIQSFGDMISLTVLKLQEILNIRSMSDYKRTPSLKNIVHSC